MRNLVKAILVLMIASACDNFDKEGGTFEQKEKVDQVFEATLAAHGGSRYENAEYEFIFRDKKYRFRNDGDSFRYELSYEKNDTLFEDLLDNNSFERKWNGEPATLTSKKEKSGREAINSVIYFATLPHKLKDESVNKSYEGETSINGKKYDVLKVNFDEEGGGTDHEDNYYYWINQESNLIDFLAYDYQVNEGGVRFREGHNKRTVDGIVFQDYVNYKAELGTPLAELPQLFEEGKLEKLSDINTEEVKSLRAKE